MLCIWKTIAIFAGCSFWDYFRCLAGFLIRLFIYKCYIACKVILGSVSDIFRYTHIYTEICGFLIYSEAWHIPIRKQIQTLRYIHNTILNIFTKASSWTFDTVLNVPVFYRCYLTSRVPLRYLLTLHFRHFLAYSRIIQPC